MAVVIEIWSWHELQPNQVLLKLLHLSNHCGHWLVVRLLQLLLGDTGSVCDIRPEQRVIQVQCDWRDPLFIPVDQLVLVPVCARNHVPVGIMEDV